MSRFGIYQKFFISTVLVAVLCEHTLENLPFCALNEIHSHHKFMVAFHVSDKENNTKHIC